MNTVKLLCTAFFITVLSSATAQPFSPGVNPLVNFDTYDSLMKEVKTYRANRLIDKKTFIEYAKDKNTIILDTRSTEMYNMKHVKGARHLNFSDFSQWALRNIIPNDSTRILIYCNNNFYDDQRFFVSKAAVPLRLDYVTIGTPGKKTGKKAAVAARPVQVIPYKLPIKLTLALNIPTFINLYGYGYKNVYELKDLVSAYDEELGFEGKALFGGFSAAAGN